MTHEHFMQRCIDLAKKGIRSVSPNPMVGVVLVYYDSIIREGFHQKSGEGHAEVNCLNGFDISEVEDPSKLVLYVSLEPCCHFGKTPPCADLIINKKIPKVVVGSKDPNPKVNGGGVKRLRDHGIEVIEGVLEKECDELNKRFNTVQRKKRPHVILKWAQTKDGFVARKDYTSKWISNSNSRKLVHQWRSEEDGILVGKNTVIHDNPSLTVREVKGENPIRIVLDSNNELSKDYKVFDNEVETIHITSELVDSTRNLNDVLAFLLDKGIQSVFVEGGSTVLSSFIDQGLWDEARVFIGAVEFVEGIKAPSIGPHLLEKVESVEEDILMTYRNYGEV